MACSKFSRQSEGFINNALDLDIVTDKILEHLPIRMAARASVLSKQWRRSWLSLKKLVFDDGFWSEQCYIDYEGSDWQKGNKIISNILLNHDGPVHYFQLYYDEEDGERINHNHWLPFLSKHGVRNIAIRKLSGAMLDISSYIFSCSDLEHLEIDNFVLHSPPTGFSGYRNLKHLVLSYIYFGEEGVFWSLVVNCRMLASLILEKCSGMERVVIDVPSLKTLVIIGCEFESIAFENVHHLETLHISDATTLIGVTNLASSSQLQSINFDGQLCELLAEGDALSSLPVKFNYVNKLCLYDLDFGRLGVLRCVLGIIESCPYIKLLDISVIFVQSADEVPELDYDLSCKLDHLLEVKFEGIQGSHAELKLVEYLFVISPVLEKLSFMPSRSLDIKLELEMSRKLMKFPRASPNAQLVYLKKSDIKPASS